MMRIFRRGTYVCLAMMLSAGLYGQAEVIRPVPNWRLGDKREVEVQVETQIVADTLKLRSSSSATYQIEVTSARKDGYEITVRSWGMEAPTMELIDRDVAMLDSVNQLMETMFQAMYEPLSKFDFRYRVDRDGTVLGLISGKDDRRKLTTAMSEAADRALSTLARTLGEPSQPIPPDAFAHVVDSLYDAFLEVQVNGMNYFLKVYATEFPLTGSLRQPVLVEDIQAPLHTDFPTIPGILEAGLDKNDAAELVGRTITTYDPDALFSYMQKQHNASVDQREGLFMDEECVERFDKRSGWLTRSTSSTRLRMGPFKMNMLVTTLLKPIR